MSFSRPVCIFSWPSRLLFRASLSGESHGWPSPRRCLVDPLTPLSPRAQTRQLCAATRFLPLLASSLPTPSFAFVWSTRPPTTVNGAAEPPASRQTDSRASAAHRCRRPLLSRLPHFIRLRVPLLPPHRTTPSADKRSAVDTATRQTTRTEEGETKRRRANRRAVGAARPAERTDAAHRPLRCCC